MRLSYVLLFSVSVPHTYYVSGFCPDLEFVPTPETRAAMERHRLRLRSLDTGFEVYFEADSSDDPMVASIPSINFRFGIKVKNNRFMKVTAPTTLGYRETNYFFGKAGATTLNPGSMILLPLVSTFVVPVTPANYQQTFQVIAEGGGFRLVDIQAPLEVNAEQGQFSIDGRKTIDDEPVDPFSTAWELAVSSELDSGIYSNVPFRFDPYLIDGGFWGMLEISSTVTAAAAGINYAFNFGSLAAEKWDYYIVKRGGGAGVFTLVEDTYGFTEDTGFDSGGGKALELLAGQPALSEVVKITSDIELPHSETPLAIDLQEDGVTILSNLPNINVNSAKYEVVVYV